MKIAYVCNSQIPSGVASSIHVMRMCQALARDHDVTLFCPTGTGVLWTPKIYPFYGVEPSFRIRRLPRPGSWTDRALGTARLLRWQAALRSFDLIYARCNAWRGYALHKVSMPLILEAHLLRRACRIQRLFRRPWLQGLVFISDTLRRDYLKAYDLDGVNLMVAHDAADPATPQRPARLPGSNAVRCGYVGNLYEGKGVEIIVPLAQRCPQVDFHVFGGSGDEVARWRATMRGAKIANLWFHGALRPADTDAARLACDLLIAPYQKVVRGAGNRGDLSRWMSPLKIFEYMAAGKAIIASDLPALREVLHHRENAMLVAPDDLDAWVRAVSELAADPGERRRLGASARDAFDLHHSWRARARRIVATFAPAAGELPPRNLRTQPEI